MQIDLKHVLQSIQRQNNYEIRTAISRDQESGELTLRSFVAVPSTELEGSYLTSGIFDYGNLIFTNRIVTYEQLRDGFLQMIDNKTVTEDLVGESLGKPVESTLISVESTFEHNRVYSRTSWGNYPMYDYPYDVYQASISFENRFQLSFGEVNKKGLPYFFSLSQARTIF